MLSQPQREALAELAGRDLTADDLAQLDALVAIRNDVAIAAHLSVRRQVLQRVTERVGTGTILAVMSPRGGHFLDAIEAHGDEDRELYWGMDPIRRGAFDPGLPDAQKYLDKLIAAMPEYQVELERIKALGYAAAPVHFSEVSAALNKAEGRVTL